MPRSRIGRSFFLRPWFPDVAAHSPTESFYYVVHGPLFAAWYVLLVAQAMLRLAG